MTYSVKFYGVDGSGIPAQWPHIVTPSESQLPGDDALFTDAELALHRATLQSQYDAWNASQQFKSSAPDLIKLEADRRVISLTGDVDAKVNKVAAMVSLLDLQMQAILTNTSTPNPLNQQQQAMMTSLRQLWAAVSSIRTTEASLKARAAGGETFDIPSSF